MERYIICLMAIIFLSTSLWSDDKNHAIWDAHIEDAIKDTALEPTRPSLYLDRSLEDIILSLNGRQPTLNGFLLTTDICAKQIPQDKIDALMTWSQTVNEPLGGLGFFGAHYLAGKCFPHNPKLGMKLIRLAAIASIAHLWGGEHGINKTDTIVMLNDFIPREPYFTQLTGLQPIGKYRDMAIELEKLVYGDSKVLYDAAEKLEANILEIFGGTVQSSSLHIVREWKTLAAEESDDLQLIIDTAYWLYEMRNNPSSLSDKRIHMRNFIPSNDHAQLLNSAVKRGIHDLVPMIFCNTVLTKPNFRDEQQFYILKHAQFLGLDIAQQHIDELYNKSDVKIRDGLARLATTDFGIITTENFNLAPQCKNRTKF